ncbi:MAG: hypothetical protein Q8M76_16365, partial [Spirochaetaceae bacterium]|nr:hypothetical protein [Spirochaetaceae bacterium]
PPAVEALEGGGRILSTRLESGITEEIAQLIRRSTEIRIVYDASLYTAEGMRYDEKIVHSILYRSLSENYQVTTAGGSSVEPSFQGAVERFISLDYVVDVPDARLLVLRARLEIPGIEDDDLVASLWNGAEPRTSYGFRNPP